MSMKSKKGANNRPQHKGGSGSAHGGSGSATGKGAQSGAGNGKKQLGRPAGSKG